MTPERIGPYRIVRKLGEGGMGAVLEAVQEPIGRRVAVKILHPKYAQEPSITARFFNEARAVNLIDHPGIVQVSDYGQLPDGTAYLVMEYLKGDTLNQRAKRAPLSLPEVLRISRQIAAALTAAHEKNVYHRDLKPDNIMIVPDHDADQPGRERVKLLDFGIAKVAEDTSEGAAVQPKTATDVVMGTPRYMAPEQCRGGVVVDGKADVYSLGVLLFELLAGRPPFVGASGEVLAMHIYEPAPSLREFAPHVPDELINLVNRLLSKKKEERPTMAEAQAALDAVSVRHPTSVLQAISWTPPGAGPATPSGVRPLTTSSQNLPSPSSPSTLGISAGEAAPEATAAKPSNRRWLPLGAGLLLLLGIGGAFLVTGRKPPPPLVVQPEPVKPPETTATPPPPTPPTPATPRRVHFAIKTTPPGAQIVRASDNKLLGTAPWQSDEESGSGQLDLRLRLAGYSEKLIHLDRSADQDRSEPLEPLKRPGRPGWRPPAAGRPGGNSAGKSPPTTTKPPGKDEQPRIVD